MLTDASSKTVTACAMTTSSRTPAAPIIIPASSRPRISTPTPTACRKSVSSEPNPVRNASRVTAMASAPVIARLDSIPRSATWLSPVPALDQVERDGQQHSRADDADNDGVAVGEDLWEDEAADEDGAQHQSDERAHALPASNGDDDQGEESGSSGEGQQPDVVGDLEERFAVGLLGNHDQCMLVGPEADGGQRRPHSVVGQGDALALVCAFRRDFHVQLLCDHRQATFVGEGFLFDDVEDARLHGFFEAGDLLIVLDRWPGDVQGDQNGDECRHHEHGCAFQDEAYSSGITFCWCHLSSAAPL